MNQYLQRSEYIKRLQYYRNHRSRINLYEQEVKDLKLKLQRANAVIVKLQQKEKERTKAIEVQRAL